MITRYFCFARQTECVVHLFSGKVASKIELKKLGEEVET